MFYILNAFALILKVFFFVNLRLFNYISITIINIQTVQKLHTLLFSVFTCLVHRHTLLLPRFHVR